MALAVAMLGGIAAATAADLQRGETAYQKCYACHSVVPGETGLTGPNLFGVVGRAVAGGPEFAYSDALKALPERGYRTWTKAALDAFLASPEDFAPGTAMTFVGMPDAEERADLIAYLAGLGASVE
jgi:cytochrome c